MIGSQYIHEQLPTLSLWSRLYGTVSAACGYTLARMKIPWTLAIQMQWID